jgi:outer membrane murein-binding lipoprotein Lpp
VEKEFEYAVDVRCASPTMAAVAVVGEYTGDHVDGNAEGLYARVEALEADRAAMRREMAALRAERAQLVMAREMARRLCWEVVSEQKTVAKKAVVPARTFSALGICKV